MLFGVVFLVLVRYEERNLLEPVGALPTHLGNSVVSETVKETEV